MSTHLILTVGTGTAGRHSNLAAGLRRTLELIAPERFWLVPSASEDSILVADLVREGLAGFQPWGSEGEPYRCIALHDSLADCRATVREVIAAARRGAKGARLLVNPTSGTKQMSAGATLAALDEGVGEIIFTIGERSDGVVVTGTEKLETFNPASFFAERDLATAARLFEAGAHRAAASLLSAHLDSGHPEVRRAQEVAHCAYDWQGLRFGAARQTASRSDSPVLLPLRSALTRLGEGDGLAFIAELLASAGRCLDWQEPDEALSRGYRAAELMAQFQLAERHGITKPYALSLLQEALPSRAEAFAAQARKGTLQLGLGQAFDTLQALGDPLAKAYFATNGGKRLSLRNDTLFGHGNTSVSSKEVQPLLQDLTDLARTHLNIPEPEPFPRRLI